MIFKAIISIALLTTAFGQNFPPPSENFEHSKICVTDQYRVLWNVLRANKSITFEVQAKTTGWVGFGLSPNGNMVGSDVIIAWIDSQGVPHITDRFAEATALPPIDDQQDYNLIEASVNGTFTIFKFWRFFDTCDHKDLVIKDETNRLVYAWNDQKPADDGTGILRHTTRGTVTVGLLTIMPNVPMPDDVQTVDFLMSDFSVSKDEDTKYGCRTFKMPALLTIHHAIKFEAILSPGNVKHVHHLSISFCPSNVDHSFANLSWECGPVPKPAEIPDELETCVSTIFAWAIGGEPFFTPPDVGLRFGGPNAPTVMFMEMHYDNPGPGEDFLDSSGVRVYYTGTPRPIEGGVIDLFAYMATENHLMVPPGSDEMYLYGMCGFECMDLKMKERGINNFTIFATYQHSHLTSYGMRTRHFREGKEIEAIAVDDAYDFDFQETRYAPEPVTILPGDDIFVECKYKTTDRNNITWGGYRTRDEMCQVIIYTYPNLGDVGGIHCASRPSLKELSTFLGITDVAPNGTALAPSQFRGKIWEDVAYQTAWDDNKRNDYQKLLRNHEMDLYCLDSGNLGPMENITRHLSIESYVAPRNECPTTKPPPTTTSTSPPTTTTKYPPTTTTQSSSTTLGSTYFGPVMFYFLSVAAVLFLKN